MRNANVRNNLNYVWKIAEKWSRRNQMLFFILFQNIKLISILVQQGKLQEEELESVLKFLFPTKYVNIITQSCYPIFIRMPLRDFICVERHVGRVLGSCLALNNTRHIHEFRPLLYVTRFDLVQPRSRALSLSPGEDPGNEVVFVVFKWLKSMLNNFQYPEHSLLPLLESL